MLKLTRKSRERFRSPRIADIINCSSSDDAVKERGVNESIEPGVYGPQTLPISVFMNTETLSGSPRPTKRLRSPGELQTTYRSDLWRERYTGSSL